MLSLLAMGGVDSGTDLLDPSYTPRFRCSLAALFPHLSFTHRRVHTHRARNRRRAEKRRLATAKANRIAALR
jgi:hypothetical protein